MVQFTGGSYRGVESLWVNQQVQNVKKQVLEACSGAAC